MTAFLVLLAVASGGYAAVVAALAARVRWGAPAAPPVPEAELPAVTVVVAARDEEATIARCLDALARQDYPADRLTVVVADDHSADRTPAVVRGWIRRHAARPVAAGADDGPNEDGPDEGRVPGGPAVRYLRVPSPLDHVRGKAQALHAGFTATGAPVLLVTDADCAPPPGWVRATVAEMADPAVGIVCGMSRVAARPDRPFDRAQALDWAFLLGATSALAEAGLPATGMGNNMAVRRAAYDGVGGYPALPFSVTEDFTLVRAVAESARPGGGRWRVRFPLAPQTTVWTLPAEGVTHAYAQRRRWARGGLVGGAPVLAAYAALFAAHALPAAALALAPALAPAAGLAAVAAMSLADAALLGATLARTGPGLRPADLPRALAFRWLYLLTLPAVLLVRPGIGWKGRTH